MNTYKIYKYTNLITGMSYIGQTCQTLRKRAGLNMIKYRECEKFWEAIQHYGTDCWSNEILWDGLTLDEANIYEQVEIRDNETLYPYGYNLSEGGMGVNPSQETCQKISESVKKAFAESPEIWYEAQRLATEAAAKKNRGQKRPTEVCEKMSVSSRNPDYTEMHAFFLSIPTDMHLSEKTRLIRERFPNVVKNTIYLRLRKWTGEKGSNRLPVYQEVYEFYLTLPSDMPLPRKRFILHQEFLSDVARSKINKWLNTWSGTQTLKRHPDYSDVNDLFLTLPLTMSLSEKRRLLYKEFPNIKKDTIRSWTHTDVDEGAAGYIFSEERKKKQKSSETKRDKTRKKTLSREHRQNISEALKRSPKFKAHLESLAQRPVSDETRQKRSEAMTGFKHSEESKEIMSEKAKEREAKKRAEGYTVSDETREKLRKASTGRVYSTETREVMSEKAKERESRKKAEGYTVSAETRKKHSEASQRMWNERRPPKHLAKEFYFSLPDTLSPREKHKRLHEEFSELTHSSNINKWLREWSGDSIDLSKHPKHYDVKNYFLSLPSEMNPIAKREKCYAKFPDILKSTIGRWIQKWGDVSDGALGHRHPKYYDVREFFLTLPPDLDIQEKRNQCYAKFSDVLQGTICRWINKWQSHDSSFITHERQKNREQGYELFMSLPHSLTIEENQHETLSALSLSRDRFQNSLQHHGQPLLPV